MANNTKEHTCFGTATLHLLKNPVRRIFSSDAICVANSSSKYFQFWRAGSPPSFGSSAPEKRKITFRDN